MLLQILFEGKKKSLSGSESSDTAVPDGGDLSAAEGGESAVSEGGDSTAVTEETEEGICCVTMVTHIDTCILCTHTFSPSALFYSTLPYTDLFPPLSLLPTHTTRQQMRRKC